MIVWTIQNKARAAWTPLPAFETQQAARLYIAGWEPEWIVVCQHVYSEESVKEIVTPLTWTSVET